jgi:hypothetical protein
MKKISIILIFLILTFNLSASDFSDKKMSDFFNSMKSEKYESGIVKLLSNSILEEKIVNVTQNLNNWVNQFTQISSLYGNYISYEKVFSIKLGAMEETFYFVNCSDYPIQIVITEYDNGRKIQLVNLYFDDKTLETLEMYGKIEDFTSKQ